MVRVGGVREANKQKNSLNYIIKEKPSFNLLYWLHKRVIVSISALLSSLLSHWNLRCRVKMLGSYTAEVGEDIINVGGYGEI